MTPPPPTQTYYLSEAIEVSCRWLASGEAVCLSARVVGGETVYRVEVVDSNNQLAAQDEVADTGAV